MSVMKKILLLSLLLAIPFSLFAGKRLTTLTHTSKSSSESGVFTYDEKPQGLYTYQYDTNGDGDVVKVTITREKDGSTHVYDLEWEDAPDGIRTVSADPVRTDSYTLNGIRLQGAPTQQGVYIRNGKKMIVK